MTFYPQSKVISAITQSSPAVVTTTTDHEYLYGLYVRFFFPENYGMPELNGNAYIVTPISSDTFSVNVDTSNLDPFSIGSSKQSPQVIPIAEIASTLDSAEDNIS